MKFSRNQLTWLSRILEERFGHKFLLTQSEGKVLLTMKGESRSVVFDVLIDGFGQSSPITEFCHWCPKEDGGDWILTLDKAIPAPGISSLRKPIVSDDGQNWYIHYDILGLTYWMLSRKEEVLSENLDSHQRFPAVSSHAYKYGYLDRPIVDEWFQLLGLVFETVWPDIQLERHHFRINVSHDVDSASRFGFMSWGRLVRRIGGDVIKRGNWKSAIVAPLVKMTSQSSISVFDPDNSYDWLMSQSEKNSIISTFYFICGTTHARFDADYDIQHPALRNLLVEINRRGHRVGMHSSYNASITSGAIQNEYQTLKGVCEEEGIYQDGLGNRMHYLRWSTPDTLRKLEASGVTYDTTLGYADHTGFRCGTSHEYPAIDPENDDILNLRIRPLIAMESTVLDEQYMNIESFQEALEHFQLLRERCKAFGGCFNLLWHNSRLDTPLLRDLYQSVVAVN